MNENLNIPSIYSKKGKPYEMNYDEICSLLLKRIKEDPCIEKQTKVNIIASLADIHDTLIDQSW